MSPNSECYIQIGFQGRLLEGDNHFTINKQHFVLFGFFSIAGKHNYNLEQMCVQRLRTRSLLKGNLYICVKSGLRGKTGRHTFDQTAAELSPSNRTDADHNDPCSSSCGPTLELPIPACLNQQLLQLD